MANAKAPRDVAKALFADSEPESEGNGSIDGIEDDEDEWNPRERSSPKMKGKLKGKGRQVQVSHLENEMNELSIGRHPGVMLPATKTKAGEQLQNAQEDEDEDDVVPILKKKKRLVLIIARPKNAELYAIQATR